MLANSYQLIAFYERLSLEEEDYRQKQMKSLSQEIFVKCSCSTTQKSHTTSRMIIQLPYIGDSETNFKVEEGEEEEYAMADINAFISFTVSQ